MGVPPKIGRLTIYGGELTDMESLAECVFNPCSTLCQCLTFIAAD